MIELLDKIVYTYRDNNQTAHLGATSHTSDRGRGRPPGWSTQQKGRTKTTQRSVAGWGGRNTEQARIRLRGSQAEEQQDYGGAE